jgi:LysM repeat protein/ABC-type branched-subunit amino acid transport system substrate-binding protein
MMNIKSSIRTFLTFIILLAVIRNASAQVTVERSKDKVIISGTPYYIHIVKKGETAYSISRAYGITVDQLTMENPPAVFGVKEGQALRIPVVEVQEVKPNQVNPPPQPKDENKFIYHKLQPGETIYSLSKIFGVSENEIITANPGIDINKLSVGAEIAIPRREFMTERQEFAVQENNYIFHKVEKGESMSSIADAYGLTLRELRRENRNIRFPQVGDYIRIPVAKLPEAAVTEPEAVDTVNVISEEPVMYSRPSGYTPVTNLQGSLDVAVLLPFYLRENADRIQIDSSKIVKGRKIYKPVSRPEEWIYQRSIGFLEMYEGILLAADTLRSLGLDINLHVYDIKGDTTEMTRLIRQGVLSDMDLIIGPVYSSNMAIVSAYARERGIPVVSPVRLMSNSSLSGNSDLFIAIPTLEVAQNTIAKKVSEYYDKNFVFIYSDTAGTDQGVINFKEKIFNELSNRLPYEEIKFKEFLFYSRSAFNNDSINRLSHALSDKTDNILVIASEEDPVISETLQDIHALSKKYNMKVFGYPAVRGLENLDPKYFFDLGLVVYSPYWIDYSRKDIKEFNSDFRHKFLSEPSEMSYAWLGYDITYYFLSGLAIHGKEFIIHPEIHNPDLLETEFDFRRKSIDDGFENQKLYPVWFTNDYEVRLVPDDAITPFQ